MDRKFVRLHEYHDKYYENLYVILHGLHRLRVNNIWGHVVSLISWKWLGWLLVKLIIVGGSLVVVLQLIKEERAHFDNLMFRHVLRERKFSDRLFCEMWIKQSPILYYFGVLSRGFESFCYGWDRRSIPVFLTLSFMLRL